MKNFTALVRYANSKVSRTFVGAKSEKQAAKILASEGFSVFCVVPGIRHNKRVCKT